VTGFAGWVWEDSVVPLLEGAALGMVVKQIIEHVVQQGVDEGEGAIRGQVSSWFGRDRQTLAIKTALVPTDASKAGHYRELQGCGRDR